MDSAGVLRQGVINIFLKKTCTENDFVYVNHDNIKPWHHCNYGRIHVNTLDSKILADNFIIAVSNLTKISQENNTFHKDNPENESNSKFSNNLPEDTLGGKDKIHINFENLSFSFLKNAKSKHPKNLFFGHININSIRNKFESV